MALPTAVLEFAPGANASVESPTWVDISSYLLVESLRWEIGSGNADSRIRPSTLRFNLKNNTRRFDPEYAAGPYYGQLVPMVQVRLRFTHNAVTYATWRGYILEWPNTIKGHSYSFVEVQAQDGLTVLQMLEVVSPFSAAVTDLSPRAWYRFSEPVGATVLVDSSGNGYHGTPEGGPTFGQSGPIAAETDRAALFDEVDDRMVLPTAAALTGSGAFSIMGVGKITAALDGCYFYHAPPQITGSVHGLALFVSKSDDLATLTLLNTDGTDGIGIGELRVTSTFTDLDEHHIVATYDGTDTYRIYFDGVEEDTHTLAGLSRAVTVPPKVGFLHGSNIYSGCTISELALFDSELTAANVLNLYNLGATPWDNQLTSARITAVLDMIGWPAGLRDINTGISTMGVFTGSGGSAFDAILEAVETENGRAWVAGDGKFTFRNRQARSTSTPAATYSDDGADVKHFDVSHTRDDLNLFNVAQVTDVNGQVTEVRDSASVTQFYPRVISRTSQSPDPEEIYDYANWLKAQHAISRTRFRWMKARCFPDSSNTRWAALLGQKLGDLINVELTPPGGGAAIDLDAFVEMISVTVSAGMFEATYQLSPADGQRMLVLDDPVLAKLDSAHAGGLGW